jgi:hypothetical protein
MCNPKESNPLEHFMELLRSRYRNGSAGIAAKKLVDAVSDHAHDLDAKAAQGFIEFFDLFRSAADTAEALLEKYKNSY